MLSVLVTGCSAMWLGRLIRIAGLCYFIAAAAAAAAAVASLRLLAGGNVERAGDWLFSHMDDLPEAIASVKGQGAAAGAEARAAGNDASAATGNR
jgi:hypothetical protein